jgi:hypothetical protein
LRGVGRTEDILTWFWWENLKEKDHLEDLAAKRRTIVKRTLKSQHWCLDGINLAEGRDKWRAAVKTVMRLWFP